MKSYCVLMALALAVGFAGCGDDGTTSPGDGDSPTVQSAFDVTPAAGTVITDFVFDASASSTSRDSLEFRWDWENDGAWDTDWVASAVVTHRYSSHGGSQIDTIEVLLEARSGATTDSATGEVIIDARHGLVLETLPVHVSNPSALGSDDAYLWLADWGVPGTRRLYKVDPASGDTLYSILSPDEWPCGVVWDGACICVTGNRALRKLAPVTGDLLGDFSVVYSEDPGGLAWDGEIFYHGSAGDESGADGRIHRYSADGEHLSSFVPPHGSIEIEGLAFDGKDLWVTLASDDTLYVLDPDSGNVLRAVHVSGQSGDVAVLGDLVWTHLGDEALARVVP
jgi:hypothetical protein